MAVARQMKKLSLKFLSVLAFLFVVIAGIQYWHRGILFESWLDQDFKKAGGLIFAGIQHRQSDLWAAREQSAKITARLFARLLSQSPDETAQQDAEPPSVPFRLRVGEGENALGIFASAGEEMPAQAQAAVAFVRARPDWLALHPAVFNSYFISKDNWLASLPAKKALDLPEGLDLVRDPLYEECTPAKNPKKAARYTRPRFDRILGRWVISITLPIYIDGGFQGVVGHDIPVEPLLDSLADYNRPPGGGEARPRRTGSSLFLMDDSFGLLLHRDLASRMQAGDPTAATTRDFSSFVVDSGDLQVIKALAESRSFPTEKLLQMKGGQGLLLTWREPHTGWRFVFTLDAAGMFANTRKGEGTFSLVNTVVLFLGLALLFLFLRAAITRPLVRIEEDMHHFQKTGRARLPMRRPIYPAEIGRLATDLQQAFSELQQRTSEVGEAKEQLEKLMQTSQSIVITTDRRLRPTFINEFGLKKLQIDGNAVRALRAQDFLERKFLREAAAELKLSEHIAEKETTLMLRTGEKIDIALSLAKIHDSQGKASGFLAVIADISKRKKAEIDLKNQILFSRQIFQSIPEMILIVDRRLRVTFINKRARDLISGGGAAVIGQNLNSILARNSIESGFDELVRSVLEGGNSVHRINTLNPLLETENYVDLIIEPLKSGNVIIGGIIMLRDISEWRGLTAQLRSLQGFMQKLINASPYAVVSINEHGQITTWNSAAEKILGIPFANAFGKNLFSLLPLFDKYKDAINEIMILKKTIYLNDEQIYIGEEDFKVANLTLYPVTAEQNGVVIHIEDVSALKQLESSLIHAQKMESLGLLTSHIIHDFNNLLSGIMGYASLLEKKIADNPKLQKYISTIITSSERASTLINQLLNFSRKKMAEKEIVSLNDLIKESLDFLAMNLKTINLDIQLNESQILLQADKTKISQVIINLIVNARDALENIQRPIIHLRTDRVEISNQSNLLDGRYALIEISDNGSGISPENQKKIFEPFFTTKGQGRGTGLGLAIVREIIQDYNGRIELVSEPGLGTTFTILLPIFEEPLTPFIPQEEKAPEAPLEGLVLLIDDEEVVRDIGCDMLKTLGLNCLTAANGAEGIEIFKKNAAEVILVILDIEMPGITGEKVFQILRELRPEIKILIASGYGREYLEAEVFKGRISHYIPKPFKIEQLSYQVNKILGGRDD